MTIKKDASHEAPEDNTAQSAIELMRSALGSPVRQGVQAGTHQVRGRTDAFEPKTGTPTTGKEGVRQGVAAAPAARTESKKTRARRVSTPWDKKNRTCGQCPDFRRIDHPHLGHCKKGQPEPIAGIWDTDRRYCPFMPE